MSLVFAIEPLTTSWDEMVALAAVHWQETEGYRHGQPFSPLFERYNQYDKLGWFMQFTARDEGRMVGYSGMYLVPSMHTQLLLATEDSWFLLPEYRKGRNAIRFYKYVEAECVSRGAAEIAMTAKMTNGAGRILEYLDFNKTSIQYTKQLVRLTATS